MVPKKISQFTSGCITLGTIGGCTAVLFSGVSEIEDKAQDYSLEDQRVRYTQIIKEPVEFLPREAAQPIVVFSRETCVRFDKNGKDPETASSKVKVLKIFRERELPGYPLTVVDQLGDSEEIIDWREFTRIKSNKIDFVCADP